MANVSESPINSEMIENIKGAATEGASIIKVNVQKASTEKIIKLINTYVTKAKSIKDSEIDIWLNRSLIDNDLLLLKYV